jgi:membrane peptidoglycan carboxypeptidase
VIEILLAYWLDRQVEKDEQLEIYLCAVRYARGVNGIVAAAKHYFGKTDLSDAQVLVLVERISSATGRYRGEAVFRMLSSMMISGLISSRTAYDTLDQYGLLLQAGSVLHGDSTPDDTRLELVREYPAY